MIDFRTQKRNTTPIGSVTEHTAYSTPLLFGSYTQNSYLTLSAVYAALDLISSSIAEMPLNVRTYEEGRDTVVPNHPISALFDNMLQSRFTFMKLLVWDLLWHGNGYCYIKRDGQGNPIKLVYLQHGDVSVEYNKTEGTVLYIIANHLDVPQTAKPENILHIIKNTRDGITGIGILAYASQSFKLADNLNSAANDFFGSGCGINGILKFAGIVPDKSKKEIREQWTQIHAPGANGSGLAVIGGDADYIPVSQDPSRSQMLESRQFGISEIARYFGISPLLLQDLSNGTANIEEVAIQFVKFCLNPIVHLIESEFNRKLFKDSKLFIDLDETTLLSADKQAMSNYISSLTRNGIITINEARKMLDLNPVENGDQLFIPYTDLAQNTINANNDESEPEQSNSQSEEPEPEIKARKKTRKKTTK